MIFEGDFWFFRVIQRQLGVIFWLTWLIFFFLSGHWFNCRIWFKFHCIGWCSEFCCARLDVLNIWRFLAMLMALPFLLICCVWSFVGINCEMNCSSHWIISACLCWFFTWWFVYLFIFPSLRKSIQLNNLMHVLRCLLIYRLK